MTTNESPAGHGGAEIVDEVIVKAIGEHVERSIARELLRTGAFDPARGDLEELRREVKVEIRRMLEHRDAFHLVRDHEPTLLEEARRYAREGAYEFSITFYAAFVEHRLNGLLAQRWEDEGRDPDELLCILRSASLARKTSRTWRAIFGDRLPESLRQRILSLAELRNEFVHYKWRPVPRDYPIGASKAREESLRRAERIVEDLDRLSASFEPEVPAEFVEWLNG
ncbi:hypothetical protein [Microbacterium profundi]